MFNALDVFKRTKINPPIATGYPVGLRLDILFEMINFRSATTVWVKNEDLFRAIPEEDEGVTHGVHHP